MVAESRPETMVPVRVLRDGNEETIRVKVGRLPNEGYAAVLPNSEPERGAIQHDALDGVTVSDITPLARSEFGIPRGIQGAVVTNVERGSPSDLADLARGDVITSIERRPVRNANDAIELSERVQKQTVLLRAWRRGAGSRFVVVDSSEDRRR